MEVHHSVDGLLGGSFLREFLVTIDYRRDSLQLRRYATRNHITDEFQCVGLRLGPGLGKHRFNVATVYPGTSAAGSGISVGDEVIPVESQPLDSLNEIFAAQLLCGTVGTYLRMSLGETVNPSLANAEVSVRVDELLPLQAN